MPFPLLFYRLLSFGRRSEIQAVAHLRSLGFRIVTCGFRAKGGEVDVIAWEGGVLVFVEVKARRNSDRPEDAVGLEKQRRVIRAAQAYLSKHRLPDVQYRFDILTVNVLPGSKPDFRLLRDAFDSGI